MTSDGPRIPKPMSAAKRERDVLRLYGSAFRDILWLDQLGDSPQECFLPVDHVAQPAKDATLMAFAQLASIRLGAQRAMVSLVDGERQHILAEGTPHMSLRSNVQLQTSGNLWLGNVSIPRTWGVCETVLGIDPTTITASEDAAVVINDLSESEVYAMRTYVRDGPRVRFYAGVALTSPAGAIVGAVCVFDDKPRVGLSRPDLIYLTDLATTIMEYLDTYTLRDQYRRGEQMTRGLISFTDGATTLQPFESDLEPHPAGPARTTTSNLHLRSEPQAAPEFAPDSHRDAEPLGGNIQKIQGTPNPPGDSASDQQDSQKLKMAIPTQYKAVKALQESILPANSKQMFARAANIMRASSDLDGVLILDASVAANGQTHQGGNQEHGSEASTWESAFDSHASGDDTQSSSAAKEFRKTCQILGAAIRESTGTGKYGATAPMGLEERDLTRLLRKFPSGKVLSFTADGEIISSADESGNSGRTGTLTDASGGSEQKRRKAIVGQSGRTLKAIQSVLPGARSVAFVPFWDFQRSRWFAGCLCWSNRPERLLSPQADLTYFKVFSSSIMNELARLDAIASSEAKTTFVASISHELRSPLHGILGTLQFLQASALDSFQITMLNSMAACGHTLLDTINHVLDYAKINDTKRNISSKRLKGSKTIRVSSKPLKTHHPNSIIMQKSAFDLALASEEVVEAVFAGLSYQTMSNTADDETPSPIERSAENGRISPRGKRKYCFIALDIAHDDDWIFCVPVGAWRRILMNIFSNALKYTQTGHIHVLLRASNRKGGGPFTHVTLTITDTGQGMSPQFLANRVFTPFTQENPHSSGTGLGLSIVRQIIETIGGKIEVSSEAGQGTKLTVKLALPRPEHVPSEGIPRTQFLEILPRLKHRRICIMNTEYTRPMDAPELLQMGEGLKRFTDALTSTLRNWLGMEVVYASEKRGHSADIVICPEVSFEYLAAIRKERTENESAPVTVFVAMDALEAATLRSDARIANKQSVVEIMTQPCGPYKLARLLNHCLNRYESADENILSNSPAYSSPRSTTDRGTSPQFQPIEKRVDSAIPSQIIPPIDILTPDSDATPIESAPSVSHVLITDDNPVNRRLLVAFMKKQKMPYQEATNGLEAVQLYQNCPHRIDFILMDISMPVMDGMSATRAIREHENKHNVKPPANIIALTGLASASARLEAWSSGVDCFMTKPVDFKVLERVLRNGEKPRGWIERT
ncbi:hypothetical protein BCR34DRAFT_597924 [Clohesyomyces aquaticus]|uniref:Sensor histidine kinase-like protein/response regulator n=1 Tax=Clohesyomyces aquaticus TaxID=1231657 RepID=A0A1Y2A0V2_9PLEO|nr:hypothetical protein BCR34DRAFT_597924 [Clohesyomyces aquaticus]